MDDDVIEQLDKLLASTSVSWLFGAGVSKNAGVPLMGPLTDRVIEIAPEDHKQLLESILAALPDGSHIEHILSHLADHIAIAERSRDQSVAVLGVERNATDLGAIYETTLQSIAQTVRWGYRAAVDDLAEVVGEVGHPIIAIEEHLRFANALFYKSQAGVGERRRPVHIFTTNYDTLVEDALGLACVSYWDGFTGGAVAYRSHRFGSNQIPVNCRAYVVKLHGSVDWHVDEGGQVWRVRDGDSYPQAAKRVLIYPQSSKYLATQRDPFAAQFELFRRQIGSSGGHVLVTCGYSFGDEHINDEIQASMARTENDTALVALVHEGDTLPPCLESWRSGPRGQNIYILTEKGIYVGPDGPYHAPPQGEEHDWWTFDGLATALADGLLEASK